MKTIHYNGANTDELKEFLPDGYKVALYGNALLISKEGSGVALPIHWGAILEKTEKGVKVWEYQGIL